MAELSWLGDYAEQFLKSPSWCVPIAEFIDEHCALFLDEEESTFPQTECHQQFCGLIDSLFCAHLLQVDVSPEDFAEFAAKCLSTAGNSHAKRILVDELSSVSDFVVFKKMMLDRNKSLDAATAEAAAAPNPPSPERKPMNEIGNAVPVAPIAGVAKAIGYDRDGVLQLRKAERDEQLRKWL
jgi:hypothetical protein